MQIMLLFFILNLVKKTTSEPWSDKLVKQTRLPYSQLETLNSA